MVMTFFGSVIWQVANGDHEPCECGLLSKRTLARSLGPHDNLLETSYLELKAHLWKKACSGCQVWLATSLAMRRVGPWRGAR